MALPIGEFTKQLAQQAILNATSKEPESKPAPAAPPAENSGAVMLAQITAMQKKLKDDEELIVLFHNGAEKIRVMEIFMPSWRVAVLSGLDQDRVLARVISAVEALQLVVRVGKVQPGAKPARIGMFTPK